MGKKTWIVLNPPGRKQPDLFPKKKKKSVFEQGENVLFPTCILPVWHLSLLPLLDASERSCDVSLSAEALRDGCSQSNAKELLEPLPVCVERRAGHVSSQQCPKFSELYYEFRSEVGVFLQDPSDEVLQNIAAFSHTYFFFSSLKVI